MKLPPKENLLWLTGVLGLAVILVVLAVLQYHWTQELSEAAGDRMKAGLQSSMVGFREDLGRQLQTISLAMEPDPRPGVSPYDAEVLAKRLETWKANSTHSDLVSHIFVAKQAGDDLRLSSLNTAAQLFEQIEWPSELSDSRGILAAQMWYQGRPFDLRPHIPVRQTVVFLQRGGPPSTPWFIDESTPALLHAQIRPAVSGPKHGNPEIEWIIVELNASVLKEQVLPELAHRYFGSSDGLMYDVAVTTRDPQNRLFYSSTAQFGSGLNIPTDGRLKLFGPPIGRAAVPGERVFHEGPPPPDERIHSEREARVPGREGPFRLVPLHHDSPPAGDWELIVKHRKGSLEAALASTRRRHLIVSFGVLLVLGSTTAMIVVTSRRAHRLASLQMEFVAGVSHELRTPLAVITSAADNIADGIIEDRTKIARYGRVIRDQSRQLTKLVEQILLFAATRQHRYQYNLRSVPPEELVIAALANSAELIRTAGFTVEKQIEPSRNVMVDVPAASACLQNLIANAVKYGGEARWIGVRVRQTTGETPEVQIAVEDKGIGIEPKEQQRIFDAFYRSPAVIGAQIHGTGLGLALAKAIAEEMGGRVSLSSIPGEGSTFVLHLPCAEESLPSDQAIGAAATLTAKD